MKKLALIIAGIALLSVIATAQDSLYIYKSGTVVSKRATAQIDSIVFYKIGTVTTPPISTVTIPPKSTVTTPPIGTITSPPIGTVTTPPTSTVTIPPIGTVTYGSVTDGENNNYKTVTLGTQTWMAENLRVTKYNDGTTIPNIITASAWATLTTGAVCSYNNTSNADTIKTYGRLYNWYTVNTGKLCPTGWHIPNFTEWTTLKNYLISKGYNYDGGTTGNRIGKAMSSTIGWNSSFSTGDIGNKPSLNNTSGFNGLSGGYHDIKGTFKNMGSYGYWWSSEHAIGSFGIYWSLYYNSDGLGGDYTLEMVSGNSVRCLKN